MIIKPKSNELSKNGNKFGLIAKNGKPRETKSIINKLLEGITRTPASKYIFLGVASGWITGFLAIKVGKTAALAIGGGIILLQFANEKEYIKINWDKVNKEIDKVHKEVEVKKADQRRHFIDKVVDFARNNTSFTAGFIGGFLIGLASN